MVQGAENRQADDFPRCTFRWSANVSWHRDALVQPLMWARLIEKLAIRVNDSPELVVTQDQNMV